MKKAPRIKRDTDMLEQYDFSKGVRGKYAKRYRQGTNVVVLTPELARVFPDSESVNATLADLVRIARRSMKRLSV